MPDSTPEVLIVSPPFLSSIRPSMGVSALLGALRAQAIDARGWYLNIEFAAQLGLDLSEWISQLSPVNLLLGEWVFAGLLEVRGALAVAQDDAYPGEALERLPPGTPCTAEALHRARALAGPFIEQAAVRVAELGPRVLGISTSFQQTCAALALAAAVKRLAPHIEVCFGGANCDLPMGQTLLETYPQIDYVFSGEADHSFARHVLGGRESAAAQPQPRRLPVMGKAACAPPVVSRGVVKADPVVDMDALAMPYMDDYFDDLERSGLGPHVRPGLVMESSRGCWWGAKHHCRFCGLNAQSLRYRSKSPQRVRDEIATLTARHDVHDVQAVDNILDPRHVAGVLAPMAEAGQPRVRLFFEVKANMKHEQLRTAARAGVTHVQPGIESLDDALLGLMDKGVSGLLNVAFLRSCQEVGIVPIWNVLYRLPGEQWSSYANILRQIPIIEHLAPPSSCSPVRLDRYSPYFEQAQRFGYEQVAPFEGYRRVFGLPPEQLSSMAYYFVGESTQVLPRERMQPLLHGVQRWRNCHDDPQGAPVLRLVSSDGDRGVVLDTRTIAATAFVPVDAAALAALRIARRPSAPARVEQRLVEQAVVQGPDQARTVVEQLVRLGFLLAADDKLISVVCEPEDERAWVVETPSFPGGEYTPGHQPGALAHPMPALCGAEVG